MNAKPGYKLTEAGIIPEEWAVKTLRSVLHAARLGGNYANQESESAYPLMKMGNLGRGVFDLSKVEYIKPNITPEKSHRLAWGDVLFNTRNTLELVGKVAIWRDALSVAYYNSNLMRLEFDTNEICSAEYANYAFNTIEAISRLRALATGTTSVAAIYTRDLLAFSLVVPAKHEQEAIAEGLSDADALIESLEQLIAKKRQIKQGAMQQLLTSRKRLPGFDEPWQMTALSEVCSLKSGIGITAAKIDKHSPYRCYGGNGLRGFTTEYTHNGEFALIGRQGALCGNVLGVQGKFYASEHALVVTAQTETDIVWLTHILGRMNLNQYSESSAQPGLSAQKLSIIEVFAPPSKAEQTAIAEILSDMDAEITELETKLVKARQVKRGMMQQLLTGRIRLVEPEVAA